MDWHVDAEFPNTLSFIFMPSAWKPEYRGALLFKDSIAQKEHNLKIEYKKNRLIAFYGNTLHKSDIHFNPNNRYTFAIKSHVDMVAAPEYREENPRDISFKLYEREKK
jgi:hypothetical protein